LLIPNISNQPFLDVEFYGEAIITYKRELKLLGVLDGFENCEKNYKLIIDNFEFSSSSITSDATALILKCIRYDSPCDGFLSKLRGLKWLRTNVGFHAPNESFLLDPEWEGLLMVFNGIPVVDTRFYGGKISPYKEELKKAGLITSFDEASKAVADIFKEMVLKSSFTKTSVLGLLKCYRQLRKHDPVPVHIFSCMRSENWLCTSLGFRSPSEAILFDEDWLSLLPIAKLPFINDGDSVDGLSKEIHGYKDELKEFSTFLKTLQTFLQLPFCRCLGPSAAGWLVQLNFPRTLWRKSPAAGG
jgi:sacsin